MIRNKTVMVAAGEALPGRQQPMPVPDRHHVLATPLRAPWPEGYAQAMFGMGCFWGAERLFWQHEGVYSTAVGYSGGYTPNPTYGEVCSGRTGHAEVVLVVYDPEKVSYEELLRTFWEQHDPTTPNRQGNDVGTQYRSAIYVFDDSQRAAAEASRDQYQTQLRDAGYERICTEITDAGPFYYAEEHHQQYLAKNPGGYCNHGFCQVSYAVSS
jgi:peptide-methionine (S)-S-oxide reductase